VSSFIDALSLMSQEQQKRARLEAFYSLTWLPLAASAGNAKATVTTQDDSDFLALRLRAYVTDTAATPAENETPQATLLLSIGSNVLMPDQNGLHIGTFTCSKASRAGLDFAFPTYVARSTTLTAFLTNLTPTAMNVRIWLEGIRLMNYNAPQ
jgi:hypothetical protein